ncbi:TetR/AcrR family transcriptional regulator [Jannaschia sp.]|nr:TetR/AcrR family transcriptional regulator [Jannaschia sp.]
MMTSQKKTYHHGDLKAALVQAGLEILEESGLDALSLRAIAARAGVSHTAPRNHFRNLDALLTAIAAEGFRQHAAEMRVGTQDAAPGPERLRAAAAGYVRFARGNPALFQLMFSPRFDGAEDPDFRQAGQGSYAVLRDICQGLIWPRPADSGAPGIEALRTEMLIWSITHGFAVLETKGQIPTDDQCRPLIDILDVLPEFPFAED